MKVLLLDAETTGIVSLVYSQSEILQEEVYLFERLSDPNREVMAHLKAICFLRPTTENLNDLKRELKNPRYGEYYLFFSNVVSNSYLEQLAAADEHEVVQEVQEFFGDYFAVNSDVFTMNLPGCLTTRVANWKDKLLRLGEGLASVCLSLRLSPYVRFQKSSDLTLQVAQELTNRIRAQKGLFTVRQQSNTSVVLILDRCNDPVTPLLLPWTYQAMIHEHISIKNNVVDLSNIPDSPKDLKQVVLSAEQDPFFKENMYKNFGDLGIAVKDLVDKFQEKAQLHQHVNSIEDMKKFVENYPEFQKLSGNVSKHVRLMGELQRQSQLRSLLTVSEVEQELAAHHDHAQAIGKVRLMVNDPSIKPEDALRLVLLYSLRYESEKNNEVHALTNMLAKRGISPDELQVIKLLREYAGERQRSLDIFKNKTWIDIARGQIKRGLTGVTNIYAQWEPPLKRILLDMIQGKLSEVIFPYLETNPKERPQNIIIFIVGGITYEEAAVVAELNAQYQDVSILLGGNVIHNSKSFLADVMQLGRLA